MYFLFFLLCGQKELVKRQFKELVQDVYADSYFENITNTKLLEDTIQK